MLQHAPSNLNGFLARLNGRSVLSEDEQRAILDLPIRVKQVRQNQDFFSLGETLDHSCYVLEGLVGRFDQTAHGARQISALYIRGDMPGLESVVQPTAGFAMQALSTCTILEVPHPALRALIAANQAIAEAFWRDNAVDASILAQWVVNVGRREAKVRIAHLLCEMATRYCAEPDERGRLVFQLAMTQGQLADATGLTSVHVNRSLKAPRAIGTNFHSGTVRTDDWDMLAKLGDFDSVYLDTGPASEPRLRLIQ